MYHLWCQEILVVTRMKFYDNVGSVLVWGRKPVPVLASARIKRWALILISYDYKIEHKSGQHHENADVLGRLPLLETIGEADTPGEVVLLMDTLNSTPIDSRQICSWTDWDPVLTKVRRLLQAGLEKNRILTLNRTRTDTRS